MPCRAEPSRGSLAQVDSLCRSAVQWVGCAGPGDTVRSAAVLGRGVSITSERSAPLAGLLRPSVFSADELGLSGPVGCRAATQASRHRGAARLNTCRYVAGPGSDIAAPESGCRGHGRTELLSCAAFGTVGRGGAVEGLRGCTLAMSHEHVCMCVYVSV